MKKNPRKLLLDHPPQHQAFVAIDFETADYGSDSACAVGLVRVEDGKIKRRKQFLIQPPRDFFIFTYIHGITWEDVAQEPTFEELWPEIQKEIEGADFLAAHNAGFDRAVLYSCLSKVGTEPPPTPFLCTMKLARKVWNIRPTRLPHVCERLGIDGLQHHNALSDAEACANVVLAALTGKKDAYEVY